MISTRFQKQHSLGKGEVHSSILCGSTINSLFSEAFPAPDSADLTQSRRTKHETRKPTRGKYGDSVRQPFRWRSHHDDLAPLGAGLLIVSILLTIMAARTAHHFEGWRCHSGDRATTNGRELCPHQDGTK